MFVSPFSISRHSAGKPEPTKSPLYFPLYCHPPRLVITA